MGTTYDLNAFIRSTPQEDRPDAQLLFWSLTADPAAPTRVSPRPGLRIFGYPLRPQGKGTLTLISADPEQPPLIRPATLEHPDDVRITLATFRRIRALLLHPAVQPHIAEELGPDVQVQTDEDILQACRAEGTCFHATGTCRMGVYDDAVVDETLRVRGVDGLSVADLSIAPTQISGNTYGPTLAMAWRAADLMRS